MKPHCINPTVIRNPKFDYLLSLCRNFRYNGKSYEVTPYEAITLIYSPWSTDVSEYSFIRSTRIVDANHCDDGTYEFYNNDTGEVYPMYYAVPCGKCEICCERKSKSMVVRCTAETQMHYSLPYMLTLTYDSYHLPVDKSIHSKHIQLFLKRLRIRLTRMGYDISNMRYFAVGEYGTRTQRPHYHLLFWDLPRVHPNPYLNDCKLTDYIHDAWQMSAKHTVILKRCSSAGGYSYVAKYMSKGQNVPKGCESMRYLQSVRGGGIGKPFIKKYAHYFLQNPKCHSLPYVDKFTGKDANLNLVTYFVNYLYPYVSKFYQPALQRRITQLNETYCTLHLIRHKYDKWINTEDSRKYDILLTSFKTMFTSLPYWFTWIRPGSMLLKNYKRFFREFDINQQFNLLQSQINQVNRDVSNVDPNEVNAAIYNRSIYVSSINNEHDDEYNAQYEASIIAAKRMLAQDREIF